VWHWGRAYAPNMWLSYAALLHLESRFWKRAYFVTSVAVR
jgi:hypothetical protein